MIEDEDRDTGDFTQPAANDNGDGEPWSWIDAAILQIASLIGRQMAREEFKRLSTANDNPDDGP
jgi:hypothetical protein